ncbi:MAG: choice-of-anchor D domain-containing protein, partial [Terriglobales bacterium]
LTPAQFGQRFGPAPADLAAVTAWLTRQGFQVESVAAGGGAIEFSGTAGTVASELHTEIHRYSLSGATHWANAGDPAIPAALAPVVAGVVSLNDFHKRAGDPIFAQGSFKRPPPGMPAPSLNFTDQNGNLQHALVPGDLATIYDIGPLRSQSPAINGAGEIVALVARSDILAEDFSDFRQLFLPAGLANALTTIEVGPDPGVAFDDDTAEATLDAEWAGAAAPQAQIDLVVAGSTNATDGVALAAQYIVDHNLAPVMSTSFGECESLIGAAENQFWSNLWEQAAAEGITALVSAGDNGAAGCDPPENTTAQAGAAVSGLASTPFNIAVGGTQFNEGGAESAYWSATSAADFSSALSYIPELPWDEVGSGPEGQGIWAGSGGASSLYSKPAWQAGLGVPADGQRDLPDLSLSAAVHDGYVICFEDSCQGGPGNFGFYIAGGTSASSPSLAGMMALVDQRTGARQGLANRVFYQLAARQDTQQPPPACAASGPPAAGCIFLDTASGANAVPCAANTNGCSGGVLGFLATPGYDPATGLGSVNAANLVNQWTSVTFSSSQTTLSLTPPANLVHGQSVPVAIQVAPGNGATGTPGGNVALLAQYSDGTVSPIQTFALGAGGQFSGATTLLPGGSYSVVATYAGDLNFGISMSAPVSVSVGKENASVQISFYTLNAQGQPQPAATATYASPTYMSAQVAGASGQGVASGTVTVSDTVNGASVPPFGTAAATLALNSTGAALSLLLGQVGANTLTAHFNGDVSFNPADATPAAIGIAPSPTSLSAVNQGFGGAVSLSITLKSQATYQSGMAFPTAPITVFDGANAVGQATEEFVEFDPTTSLLDFIAAFNPATLPGTSATLTAQFPGDTHYAPSTSAAVSVTTPANLVFNPAVLNFGTVAVGSASPAMTATVTNQGGQSGSISKSLTNPGAYSETDNCGGNLAPGSSCTVSVTFHPVQALVPTGSFDISTTYSTTFSLALNGVALGFTLFSAGTDAVAPGQSATYPITLTPAGGFAGAVALSCSNLPPLTACSFSPASVTLDGAHSATAQLTVSTTAPPASGSTGSLRFAGWWLLALMLVLIGMTALAFRDLGRPARAAAGLLLALLAAACGSNPGTTLPPPGGSGNGGVSPPAPAVSLSPASVAFGNVTLGQSAVQTVTLTNTGQAALTGLAIALTPASGVPPADFTQHNLCSATLAAGAQCAISVTFAPTASSPETAVLSFSDNAAGSPQQVGLTGTGAGTSTPAGTYNFTVTGTSGTVFGSTTVTLIVN